MNPDLYTDIQQVLEGLQKDLDNNPMETEQEMMRFWAAYFAIKNLEAFKECASKR